MSEQDITSAMAQAMAAENRRRELAGQSPGLGALVSLPDVPYGPGVGLSDVPLPPVGESHHQAAPRVPQRKSYGPASPVYADSLIGGLGYTPGDIQTALRHVTDLGADGPLIGGRSAPAAPAVDVVSAPARPGPLRRLLGKLRRPQ
jgi:hypothetical protein